MNGLPSMLKIFTLVERYTGLTEIENVAEQKYLGFVLSSTEDNMANIKEIKKKSIGIVKSTINKLNSLHLKKYYFECAVILMNVMIRSSILYASDMYYQLKETEVRQLERIEESYLRQVLKTTKGCPINQLYLCLGQYPARFEIQKMRMSNIFFMKNRQVCSTNSSPCNWNSQPKGTGYRHVWKI